MDSSGSNKSTTLKQIINTFLIVLTSINFIATNAALAVETTTPSVIYSQSDKQNTASSSFPGLKSPFPFTYKKEIGTNSNKTKVISSTQIRSISAYNVGDIYQTDGDPCTSANGENICLALELGYPRCAANFVPFGTILEIDGFGECMVTDRMNSRYPTAVDIAMKYEDKHDAIHFGRQRLTVNIIKYQ